MGKELLQFILLFSSEKGANPARQSDGNDGKPGFGSSLLPICKQVGQIMRLFERQIRTPILRFALLFGFIMTIFPAVAPASQVTLTWSDRNKSVDGYRVYKRTEGQTFNYAKPAWPTDGRNHPQTSCTLSNLADGTNYYFVVRAYADDNQSGNSNEVTYMAPAPSPVTIVNNNHPPIAEAGVNKSANAGEWVTLDGSGSSDPDGDHLSYTWIQRSGPATDLSGGDTARCGFTAPKSMTEAVAMAFELKVTDAKRESSSDTCIIMVNPLDQALNGGGSTIDGIGNRPPEQPELQGVTGDQNGVSRTPLLKAATDFVDPNPEDYHAGTEWCIKLAGDNQHIIFDRSCNSEHLTEFQIPPLVLNPSTDYMAQVRFFDDHGLPSPWSQPVVFTTAADNDDLNRNNIPDSQEINTYTDMNGDEISDYNQKFLVKTLATYNNLHVFCVSVELNDPIVQIQAAANFSPEALASFGETVLFSEDEMPYGLLGYRIKVAEPGEIIAVKFYLSDPMDPRRFVWARHDAVDGITSCDASTDMDDSGLVVRRYLVDGGEEDADGAANGVIIDLAGPLSADVVDPGDSSLSAPDAGQAAPGGGSSGCFILSLD